MDRLRTLLLARTSTVVLDADRVASAATRPQRDDDVEKFEDELAQLGFVMSLDLAMTLRRLPHATGHELKAWMRATLAGVVGAHRPHVPLFRGFPDATPADTRSLYLRRVLSWLVTRPDQPCPWCGQIKTVGALDPCGHLVCQQCWDGGTYAGCPICHRRVTVGHPFVKPTVDGDRVTRSDGQLRVIDLAIDPVAVARDRFQRMLARTTPLSKGDREELETVIDVMGPRVAGWLPPTIPVKETIAIALARFWIAAPDRVAMVRATQPHIRAATDVLRIAAVLMGADPALVPGARLASIPRSLRRAVLGALDKLPPEPLLEDMRRHAGWWKRVGERLHPFELADKYPVAALAFAAIRGSDLATLSFAKAVTERAAQLRGVAIVRHHLRVTPWAGAVEAALRGRDPKQAVERLAERPGELLRRVDHLLRMTAAEQPSAFGDVLRVIEAAIPKGPPNTLLVLGAHVRARTAPWRRRVVFPKGDVLKAWAMPDARAPLRGDGIAGVAEAIQRELLARAERRKPVFPRAVLDRGLADLLVPIGERGASKTKVAWPRGSERALPAGDKVRLFLHWEQRPEQRVDLDLSVAFYDASWRHVATCDFTNLVVRDRAAVHSGDLTDAPPPLGASEFIDLDLEALAAFGAAHAVMVVFSYNSVPFDRLPYGFAGVMLAPEPRSGEPPFDPRAVAQRFDLSGASVITLPLTIDLAARRLRWIDVHLPGHHELHHVGGYRAALAHAGRDFEDFVSARARPTLWDVAAIHATARANVVYIRERDGTVTTLRRRDHETSLERLARLHGPPDQDSQLGRIPAADAPTFVATLTDDLALPKHSAGYVLDARGSLAGVTRLTAADLIAELA